MTMFLVRPVYVDGGLSDEHAGDLTNNECEAPFNCLFHNLDGSIGARVEGGVCTGTGNEVTVDCGKCSANCEHSSG